MCYPEGQYYCAHNVVRVLVFKECSKLGRKLVYDSNLAVKSNSCKVNFGANFQSCLKNSNLELPYENIRMTHSCGNVSNVGLNHHQNENFKNLKQSNISKTNSNNTCPKARCDSKFIGEMIFGTVELAFKENSNKIHHLSKPARIAFSRVIHYPQLSHDEYSVRWKDSGIFHSFTKTPTNQLYMSQVYSSSWSAPCFKTNSNSDLSSQAVVKNNDSGYSDKSLGFEVDCGSYMNHVSPSCTSIHTPSSKTGSETSFKSSGSFAHLQRRYLRNVAFSSKPQQSIDFFVKSSAESFQSQENVSSTSRVKFGFSFIVETQQENSELQAEAENWWLQRCDIMQNCIERFCQRFNVLVCAQSQNLTNGIYDNVEKLRQELRHILYAPRLNEPVWLSLKSSVDENRKRLMNRFINSFSTTYDRFENKPNNFYLSRILTAVLCYHLGWVSIPENSLNRNTVDHASALTAQISELFGVVGQPKKVCRTVLVSSDVSSLEELLIFLSYFIRCSQVFVQRVDNESLSHSLKNEFLDNVEVEKVREADDTRQTFSRNASSFDVSKASYCSSQIIVDSNLVIEKEDEVIKSNNNIAFLKPNQVGFREDIGEVINRKPHNIVMPEIKVSHVEESRRKVLFVLGEDDRLEDLKFSSSSSDSLGAQLIMYKSENRQGSQNLSIPANFSNVSSTEVGHPINDSKNLPRTSTLSSFSSNDHEIVCNVDQNSFISSANKKVLGKLDEFQSVQYFDLNQENNFYSKVLGQSNILCMKRSMSDPKDLVSTSSGDKRVKDYKKHRRKDISFLSSQIDKTKTNLNKAFVRSTSESVLLSDANKFEVKNDFEKNLINLEKTKISKFKKSVKDENIKLDLKHVNDMTNKTFVTLPDLGQSDKHESKLAHSRFAAILKSYSPDFVLQGVHSSQWSNDGLRELIVSSCGGATEQIAIVARVDSADAQIVTPSTIDDILISPLVAQLIDSFFVLIRLQCSHEHILECLENQLTKIYLKSTLLTKFLFENLDTNCTPESLKVGSLGEAEAGRTEIERSNNLDCGENDRVFSSTNNSDEYRNANYDLTELAKLIDVQLIDLPLLMAVASKHTPQLANMFSLKY